MTSPQALCATLAAARLLDDMARCEVPTDRLRAYRVTAPGRLLVDPARRAAALAAAPPAARGRLGPGVHAGCCRGADAAASVAAVRRGEVAVACRWLGLLLMDGVARHLAGEPGAAAAVLDAMRAWAEADAPRVGNPLGSARARRDDLPDLRLALLPAVVACAVLGEYPGLGGADRRGLHAWLRRFAACAEVGGGFYWLPPAGGLGYHRFVDDAALMALGCLTGDDAGFRRGVQRYLVALKQMRADGGWPFEVACGRFALWSHARAVGCLVLIAELAAHQGYDLYTREEPGGRSVHRAVRHLLDALDRTSEAGGTDRPPAGQERGFLVRRADGRHPMAWVEPYLARFRGGESARRLAALRGGALLAERPLVDEVGGGDATRLFMPLD